MQPPRIDAHHHLWDLNVRDQAWAADRPAIYRSFSMDDLRPALERNQIGGTVVVQTVAVAEETPEFLALAEVEPSILGVVGWVDLTAADIPDRLAALAHPALVGIRHLVESEPDPQWLARADVRTGIAEVGARELVFDLLVNTRQLPAAVELVTALDEVRFVLDHAAKPPIAAGQFEPWGQQITRLAERPNVVVKLSGLLTEAGPNPTPATLAPWVNHLLDAFGPQRMMFGSDWPVCLLAADYDTTISLVGESLSALTPTEREWIFGWTAADWYRLALPPG